MAVKQKESEKQDPAKRGARSRVLFSVEATPPRSGDAKTTCDSLRKNGVTESVLVAAERERKLSNAGNASLGKNGASARETYAEEPEKNVTRSRTLCQSASTILLLRCQLLLRQM